MITIDKFQTKITEAIRQSGLTQIELARRLGIKQQTVSAYVHQSKMPSLDTFANLCAVLDIDANEILCISSYKPEM